MNIYFKIRFFFAQNLIKNALQVMIFYWSQIQIVDV